MVIADLRIILAIAFFTASATTACTRSGEAASLPAEAGTLSSGAAAPASAQSAPARRSWAVPGVEKTCEVICDRSRRLGCKGLADCQPNCVAMGSVTPCREEVTSFYACLLGQPVDRWECSEDGVAAIREGYCDKEQERAVACMESKMQAR